MIGTEGYWIEDNDYCVVAEVIDEGAGTFLFQSLTEIPGTVWIGFIDDFSPEVVNADRD